MKVPRKPAEILLTKNEVKEIDGVKFKRSLYPEGKVVLYKGSLERCKEIVNDLGFKLLAVIRKVNCEFYEIPRPNFKTVIEYIPEIGWLGELEFEGKDPKIAGKRINEALRVLGVSKFTYKPILAIFLERYGLKSY